MPQATMAKLLSKEEMEAAEDVIFDESPVNVRRTPVFLAANLRNESLMFSGALPRTMPNFNLFFKMECWQQTKSFKIRGALNQMQGKLRNNNQESVAAKRFVTYSCGNYGLAFAKAAKELGVEGTVYMPKSAQSHRRQAIIDAGCKVAISPHGSLIENAREFARASGATFLQQDDRLVLAGHSTVGREIARQVPGVDIVLVSCGGGGLVGATAAAMDAYAAKGVKVYAVEPETANSMALSLKRGFPVRTPGVHSVACGLTPPSAGALAFAHVSAFCAGVLLVSEEQIRKATTACYDRGLVVEPSAAAALAAVMFGQLEDVEGNGLRGKNVVVVLTGSNVTPSELDDIFQR